MTRDHQCLSHHWHIVKKWRPPGFNLSGSALLWLVPPWRQKIQDLWRGRTAEAWILACKVLKPCSQLVMGRQSLVVECRLHVASWQKESQWGSQEKLPSRKLEAEPGDLLTSSPLQTLKGGGLTPGTCSCLFQTFFFTPWNSGHKLFHQQPARLWVRASDPVLLESRYDRGILVFTKQGSQWQCDHPYQSSTSNRYIFGENCSW